MAVLLHLHLLGEQEVPVLLRITEAALQLLRVVTLQKVTAVLIIIVHLYKTIRQPAVTLPAVAVVPVAILPVVVAVQRALPVVAVVLREEDKV